MYFHLFSFFVFWVFELTLLLFQVAILCKDPKGKNVFKTDTQKQLTLPATHMSQYSLQLTTLSFNTLSKRDNGTPSSKSLTQVTNSTVAHVEEDRKSMSELL